MRFFWQFLTVMVMYALSGTAINAVKDDDLVTFVLGVTLAALAVLVYGWVVRRTEDRPALDVAREGAAAKAGRGILVGAGMFAAVIVNLFAAGHYDVDGLNSVTGALGCSVSWPAPR